MEHEKSSTTSLVERIYCRSSWFKTCSRPASDFLCIFVCCATLVLLSCPQSPLPTSVTREGGNERGGSEWAETHIVLVRVGPMIALFIMVLLLMGCPKPNTLLYCFGHAFLPIQTEGAPCYLRPLLHSTERDDLATAPDKEARESRGGSNRKRLQLQL